MPLETNHPQPTVSVGILTRNAGKLFAKVLDALHGQETPWPFEVVCLDSSSRDGTDKLAELRGAKVIPYKPGKFRFGPARDKLFEHCRGQVVVTISQDVVPATAGWLDAITRPIFEGAADVTIGEQSPPPDQYSFYWDYHGSWMRSVAIRFDQAYGRIGITCSNLAIRRSVWAKVGFGDCEHIEDRNLQVKLHRGGYRMMQAKGALSYHGHDYTWRDLHNRNASFAYGWAKLGWPYTTKRLLRDLVQPSRYVQTADAFLNRQLKSWKELVYPVAMCFMQYAGSRKKQWS